MPFHREVNDDELTYRINAVAMEVHTKLGADQSEAAYRDTLAVGLRRDGLDCQVEHEVTVAAYEQQVTTRRVDLIVEEQVVLELKALKMLQPEHLTQLGSNVHGAGASRGLLYNFGAPSLEIRRFATKEWIREHSRSAGGD